MICTGTSVIILVNSCEYCTAETQLISANIVRISYHLNGIGNRKALQLEKQEFLQQTYHQPIVISGKGFFTMNRQFLAAVSSFRLENDCFLTLALLFSWLPLAARMSSFCCNFNSPCELFEATNSSSFRDIFFEKNKMQHLNLVFLFNGTKMEIMSISNDKWRRLFCFSFL